MDARWERLSAGLRDALSEYPEARTQTFASSTFPDRFSELGELIKGLLDSDLYVVRAKAGDHRRGGQWQQVPYIAILRRELTRTTQQGLYVVLLMAADCSGYYLSMNFGTKSVGVRSEDLRELARRSAQAYKVIPIYAQFRDREIDLLRDLPQPLTKQSEAYERAHICGRFFKVDELGPPLLDALQTMLKIYAEIPKGLAKRASEGKLGYGDFKKRRDPEEKESTPQNYEAPPPFSERSRDRAKHRSGDPRRAADAEALGYRLNVRDDAHEALLNEFGSWLNAERDEHNILCDMRIAPCLLIEAKTLSGDDVDQSSLALAKLLSLRHWYFTCYAKLEEPLLVALFDRKPIGKYGDILELLRSYGILSAYRHGDSFALDPDFPEPESASAAKHFKTLKTRVQTES